MIKRPVLPLMLLTLASIFLFFLLNLLLGSVHIPLRSVWNILWGNTDESVIWQNIIWKSRVPQALTALVAGAGLSVSGLQMQTVFRNPLAGPSVLGISSGASLGVACVVLLSGAMGGVALSRLGYMGEVALSVAAIIGALAVMALIVYVSQKVKGNVTLLIIGVMIGYVASAVIGVLKYFSVEEDIRAYVIWGLGSFARVSGDQMVLFVCIMAVLLPLSFLLIKTMNLLLLGDGYARNLGLNIKRARLLVISCSGVLVAIVTAYVYRIGGSPSVPCHLPLFGPSGTDACHIAGRRFPGIGLQSDSPYARLRGSFAGQLGDGTGRCAGSGFCTF